MGLIIVAMTSLEDALNLAALVFLAAAAGVFLYWLRPDPAAHLRHCPSCDHDLRGTLKDHRCPECGRYEPDELPFHRPRRRWKLLALAAALNALGIAAMWVAPTARYGWTYYATTAMLIAAYPRSDMPPPGGGTYDAAHRPVFMRLFIRLRSNQVAEAHRRSLAARLIGLAQNHPDQALRQESIALLGACADAAADTIPALVSLASCGDGAIEERARGALLQIDPRREDALVALLGDPGAGVNFTLAARSAAIMILRDDGVAAMTYTSAGEHLGVIRSSRKWGQKHADEAYAALWANRRPAPVPAPAP